MKILQSTNTCVQDIQTAKNTLKKPDTSEIICTSLQISPIQVGILCFKFSLNPLRFSLTREADTKNNHSQNAEQL